jgi:hypothetical protein
MITIPDTFGSGGANLSPGGAVGTPVLRDVLREIQGFVFGFTLTSPDGAAAAGDPPTDVEYDAVVLLANEARTAMNAYGSTFTVSAPAAVAAAADPPVAAEYDVLVALANDEKAVLIALGQTVSSPDGVAAAGASPTKAEFDVVVTLVNEIKAVLNAI